MTSTPRRKRRPAPRWLAAALAAVTAAALAACGSTTAPPRPAAQHQHPAAPAAVSTARTFLTVATSNPVTRVSKRRHPWTAYLVRYPVSTVQLRSLRNGRVTGRPLLRSLGNVEAVLAPDGSVIAVADLGCRSLVFRIDPATGRHTLIRTLPGSAGSIALSPDGSRLAYLTYPADDQGYGTDHNPPCQPSRQPARPVLEVANPGGPVQWNPSQLAIVSLATGATVHTRTVNPGWPPSDPAWSPDGRRIAVAYSGPGDPILVTSATRPDFATARRIRAPGRCGYVAATWTTAGLIAALGCGHPAELSPGTLVRLSPAGRPAARWRLPACIDGISLLTDPAARQVLVQADTGYANSRPCGHPHGGWRIRVDRVRGAALASVASYPQYGAPQFELTGW